MTAKIILPVVLLLSVVLSSSVAAQNIQVNASFAGPFPGNKQNEPSLAQNQLNPANLVAAANDQFGFPSCTNTTPSSCPPARGVGYYASFDGGQTWPCQGTLDLSAYSAMAVADPWQTFDSLGNVYIGVVALPEPADPQDAATGLVGDMFVAKSTDGGCHYGSAAKVSANAPAKGDDKDAITADNSVTSPFRNRLYAVWTAFTKASDLIMFSRSEDAGVTWTQPIPLSSGDVGGAACCRQGAAVKTGPDGTIYVAWVDFTRTSALQRVAVSQDGGRTFTRQIAAAVITDDFADTAPGSSFSQGARVFPSLTVVPGGTVYLAWANRAQGHSKVLIVKSSDGGLSWSAPTTAADVSGRSAFFASIAADSASKLNLAFLALDDVPFGTLPGAGVVSYDAYFAQSGDGGATFSSPQIITTNPSDPDGSSGNALRRQFVGDYISLASDSRGSGAFVIWTDSRNATPCVAVDAFRAGTGSKPNIIAACPATFGNTDIYIQRVPY